jgi:predicted AlkP superfamily phosphohydrolase/phosphomutase
MSSAPKVLFIGLDAASKSLVLDWAGHGLLPNIQALYQSGARGMTANAPGIYTGSVWPSIWTGTAPGSHGCYYNQQLKPGTYEVAEFLGKEIKREPFWGPLSRAGNRVCVFDIPKTPVSIGLNGIQVVDWGTHDADVPACSWPANLIDEIHTRYGAPSFRRCDWVMDQRRGETALREQLLKRIEMKTAIAEDLLRRESWDLFMVGFGDSHCAGHQLWHVHDPSHPKHDPELRARIGDPILDVYVELDSAVGRLLKYADSETTVLVVCSHGMSAHYDASYLLDEVLRRLEGRPASVPRVFLNRARKIWKTLPLSFTERFATIATRVSRKPDPDDRRHRCCFVVPTNANSPGIRLNLIGREPDGKLQPGEDKERFVAQLVEDLYELTEPSDGRQLVKEVIRSEERFVGENTNLLPDFFVRWNREKPITGVSSPKIGTILQEDYSTKRTGDHRPGGLFFLRGPGIEPGIRLPTGRDEDFASTISGLLGVELPDVEGRSLLER